MLFGASRRPPSSSSLPPLPVSKPPEPVLGVTAPQDNTGGRHTCSPLTSHEWAECSIATLLAYLDARPHDRQQQAAAAAFHAEHSGLSPFHGLPNRPLILPLSLQEEKLESTTALMCTEHAGECPVCGKEFLIYVEFCPEYHPPLLRCPNGTVINSSDLVEGVCPSPVCPNSRTGGCQVM